MQVCEIAVIINNKQHHVYDVDYTIIDSKPLSYTSRSQMTYVV